MQRTDQSNLNLGHTTHPSRGTGRAWSTLVAFLLMVGVCASHVQAQMPTVAPGDRASNKAQLEAALDGVGIIQNLGDELPMDLEFTDHHGNLVTLGDYFQDEKPVILVPVYYNCPMLCTLVLNGLVDAMVDMEWTLGEEFRVVVFSFKPNEPVEISSAKKKGYDARYGRDFDSEQWPFLTGSPESVTALLDALGYRIKVQPNGEIGHDASIMFISPDGMISQYMNDVMFEPRDVRLNLVQASDGEVGTFIDNFLLFTCFQFDPNSNSFVPNAWLIMRSAAGLTVVALGLCLTLAYLRSNARHAAAVSGVGVENQNDTTDPNGEASFSNSSMTLDSPMGGKQT